MKAIETQRRPTSPLDLMVMRKQIAEETQPYVGLKMKIYSYLQPTMVISAAGKMECQYNFSPDTKETLKHLDDLIEAIQSRILSA